MEKVQIPHAPADIPVEALPVESSPFVCVGLPAYGGLIHLNFAMSMIDTIQSAGCVGDMQCAGGDSLVSRARNNLVSMFLAGRERPNDKGVRVLMKYDWLLFLDTDLIFRPSDVRLLYDLALKRGPGIYAGTYPMKKLKPQIVFNALPGTSVDAEGVVPVREAGTGFMMIHRSVFEKMQAAYPQNDFETDGGDVGGKGQKRHDWFEVGVKNGRYLSEDWFFCQKWADMGGTTLMQTRICAQHIGTFTYPANPAEVIEVADIFKKAFELKAQHEAKMKAAMPADQVASAA